MEAQYSVTVGPAMSASPQMDTKRQVGGGDTRKKEVEAPACAPSAELGGRRFPEAPNRDVLWWEVLTQGMATCCSLSEELQQI